MKKVVCIIQARLRSTRLPGKVLYELAGKTMIEFIIERIKKSKTIDKIIIATGKNKENDAVAFIVSRSGVDIYRGSENDVLSRYSEAANYTEADVIVRLTADCPFSDPAIIDQVVNYFNDNNLDYCSNVYPPSWPDGQDVSVFSKDILDAANKEAKLLSEREHVVTWMWKNSDLESSNRFKAGNIKCTHDYSNYRWTVDEDVDYVLVQKIVEKLGYINAVNAGYEEIIEIIKNNSELRSINNHLIRDAGLQESLSKDYIIE